MSVIFLLTGDSFSVNGVLHPIHQDYTAVSIVTVMEEEEELYVDCNGEQQFGDWVAESQGGRRIVEGDPQLVVPGGITRFAVFENTLTF